MIYLQLFLGFLKVGCLSFGGAYSAIPLIRDIVMSYGWMTDEKLTYMIGVSESTPGPIMVNMATYVGSDQAGILGSLLATFAVVLPAFVIIIILMTILKHFIENHYVKAVLSGLTACVIGIILATGLFMSYKALIVARTGSAIPTTVDLRAVIIALLLVVSIFGYQKWKKKKLSPILLILISAVLGIIVYGIG